MTNNKLDLGILKVVINNKIVGSEFSRTFLPEILHEDVRQFGELVTDYYKSFKSSPTRRVLLDQNNKNEKLVPYINNIWDKVEKLNYNPEEYSYDLDKIKKRYQNKIIKNLDNVLKNSSGEDEFSDCSYAAKQIEQTIQKLKGLKGGLAYTQRTLQEDIGSFRKEYAAIKANPELGRGIQTGYSAIDFACDGFRPAELVIISGESGSGKSCMLNNIAIQMWLQKNTITTQKSEFSDGQNLIYFSLEMPFDRCRARTYARLADVPLKKLLRGQLNTEQEDRLEMALEFIENYPFQFQIIDFPRGATVEQIELRYLDAKNEFDPKVVVVDYMGLLDTHNLGSDVPDWLKQGAISGELHEFSRANSVACLSAVQMTTVDPKKNKDKEAYSPEENVGHHRIGRSKAILHHANIGIQIIKRKDETKHSNFLFQLIKNRDGENDVKGSMKKNFANASLLDILYQPEETGSVPDNVFSNVGPNENGDISGVVPMKIPVKINVVKKLYQEVEEIEENADETND